MNEGIEGRIEKSRIVIQIHFLLVTIALVVSGYILLNLEKLQALPCAIFIFILFSLSAILGVLSLIMLSNTLYEKEENLATKICDKISSIFEWTLLIALVFITINGFIYLLGKGILTSC